MNSLTTPLHVCVLCYYSCQKVSLSKPRHTASDRSSNSVLSEALYFVNKRSRFGYKVRFTWLFRDILITDSNNRQAASKLSPATLKTTNLQQKSTSVSRLQVLHESKYDGYEKKYLQIRFTASPGWWPVYQIIHRTHVLFRISALVVTQSWDLWLLESEN